MALKKAQIDNAICNIENAGGENVVYIHARRRFEFSMPPKPGVNPVKMAISSTDFVIPNLLHQRFQPSEELISMVLFQPWFII